MISIDVLLRDRLVNAQRIFVSPKSQTVNVKCPVTKARLVNPAKGKLCKHLERIELRSMLEHIRDSGKWECVFCNCPLKYSELFVDRLMRAALSDSTNDLTYAIMLMPDNSWRPVKHLTNLESSVMISAFTIAAKNLRAKRNKQSEEYIGVVPRAVVKSDHSHFLTRHAAKAERSKHLGKTHRDLEMTALRSDPRYMPSTVYWFVWGMPDLYKYDFDSNSWMNIVRIPNLQTVLLEFSLVYTPDQVFVIGGVDLERRISDKVMVFTEEYGLDNCRSMSVPRCRPAVAYLDDLVYVIGGQGVGGTLDSMEVYSTNEGTWKPLTSAPHARASATACAMVNSKDIYVFGGGSEHYDFVLQIDIYRLKFEDWDTLDTTLRRGVVNSLAYPLYKRNAILLIGGFTSEEETGEMRMLNLENMQWKSWHDLPLTMSDHWNFPAVFEPERDFIHIFNNRTSEAVEHVYYSVAEMLDFLPQIEVRSLVSVVSPDPLSNLNKSNFINR